MTKCWILIANSSEAAIYSAPKAKLLEGAAPLELIKKHVNKEGRELSQDIAADKKGRNHHIGGVGTLDEHNSPKENAIESFALELSKELDAGRKNSAYDELIIVAPPHFHGLINKHNDNKVNALVGFSIEKDYVDLKGEDIVKTINKFL